MLQVFYQSKEHWGTGVTIFAKIDPPDDKEEEALLATVEMTGGGGSSRFRYVTFYGCAIAVATAANSTIEGFEASPQELLERIKCRQRHETFEEAYEDVLANLGIPPERSESRETE